MKKTSKQIAQQVLRKLSCEDSPSCAVDTLLENWQGKSKDKNKSQFSPDALQQGMKVETEHTKDKQLAQRITMDHLTEDPKYYEKLKKVEKTASRVLKKIAAPALPDILMDLRLRNLTPLIDDVALVLGPKLKGEDEKKKPTEPRHSRTK